MPLSDAALKASLIETDAVFHNSHDAIIAIDQNSYIIFCNETAVVCFGYEDKGQLLGQRVETLMPPENAAAHKSYIARHKRGDEIPVMNRLRRIKAKKLNGDLFPIDIHVAYFHYGDERYYVSFIRDMTDVVEKEEELNRLAFVDSLTQLPNSARLKEFLAAIDDLKSGRRYLVAVLGIDQMRNINASFGFVAGDQVIKKVATRLKSEFYDELFLGRMVGDQFALIAAVPTGMSDDTFVSSIETRLTELFIAPVVIEDTRVKVSITSGALAIPDLGRDADLIMKYAEMAYGDAKRESRGRLKVLREGRLAELSITSSMTHWLEDAIQLGEFSIVIQPKIDVLTGRCNAGEVLVRWQRSDGTFIRPDIFIPVAENAGLINAIGRFVFLETCSFFHAFEVAGRPLKKLAVNVSPEQLIDSDFCYLVEDRIGKGGIDPKFLEFEVTETAVASAPNRVIASLERLRSTGASIALDDFGTGQSSLTMLMSLPIDRVKLDKTFVDRLESEEKLFSLLKNTVNMMRELNLEVTVEGVETREVHDALYALGVHETQGYYYAKPMPPAEFCAFDFNLKRALVS